MEHCVRRSLRRALSKSKPAVVSMLEMVNEVQRLQCVWQRNENNLCLVAESKAPVGARMRRVRASELYRELGDRRIGA